MSRRKRTGRIDASDDTVDGYDNNMCWRPMADKIPHNIPAVWG